MDVDQLKSFSGTFCDIEPTDGFRALVWVNGVDPSLPDHELNVDVITTDARGSHDSSIPMDAAWTVSATEVVRVVPHDTDAAYPRLRRTGSWFKSPAL